MSENLFNWQADCDTASTCLALLERAAQRLTRTGQVVTSGRARCTMDSKQRGPRRTRKTRRHGKHNPMPDALKQRIATAYAAGVESLPDMAKRFDCSVCTITAIRLELGIPARGAGRRTYGGPAS